MREQHGDNRSRSNFGVATTRRGFLAGGSAFVTSPYVSAQANVSHDVDVVIVGAGIAGVAAANVLNRAEKTVRILEASNRIGGRAHTDHSIFGVPYDLGAHWLHYHSCNPLLCYALRNSDDFSLSQTPSVLSRRPLVSDYAVYIAGRRASTSEVDELRVAKGAIMGALGAQWRDGKDISAAQALTIQNLAHEPWTETAKFLIGPWDMAKNFDELSLRDWHIAADTDPACRADWNCQQGVGELVRHYSRSVLGSLPTNSLQLNSRVNEIVRTSNGVKVLTAQGSIAAKACVVTVSTGVLNGNGIKFTPSLPSEKVDAFEKIAMGHYTRVALQFSNDVTGLTPNQYAFSQISAPEQIAIGFTVDVGGTGLIFADAGGRDALKLEKIGQKAAIDYVCTELSNMFGSSILAHFVNAHMTTWYEDPNTRGAYASAKPGSYKYRKLLREPVDDLIFFAGEACATFQWGTIGGAMNSGNEVANKQVLRALAPQTSGSYEKFPIRSCKEAIFGKD